MKNIYTLISTMLNGHRHVNPDIYLAANAELLFSTICISLVITYLFNDKVLYKNGISDMVGYNNPCVFWDDPPALYFAALFFAPMVYFAIRYAVLDTQRAWMTPHLSETWKKTILVVNFCYALSQCVNGLIFVVTPNDGDVTHMRMHSVFFLQLVPTLGICMMMNYIEGWASGVKVYPYQWAILGVSMTFTTLETFMAAIAVFGWGGYQDGDVSRPSAPIIPPLLMQFVDWGWFCTLPLVSTFDPPSPTIKIDIILEEIPDQSQTDEEAVPIKS